MTKLLEKAFREAAKLAPDEQDAVAAILLRELESDRRWTHAFRESQDALARLGSAALEEHEQGETEDLNPSTL